MKTSAVFLQLFLAVFAPTLAEIQIKFTKSPESVTAALGDTVTFECEVNVPGDKIMWRRRAHSQTEDDWRLVPGSTEKNQVTSRLVFDVQHNEQSGLYQCVAFYGSSILTSVPARLSIARMDLSSNKLERREITTPPHNTVVLHCREPASEPPAVLTWFKETGMGTKTSLDTPNGVLVIHNATSDDSGVYGCTAANEYTNEEVVLPERTNLRVQRDNSDIVKFLETEDYVGIRDETGVLTIQLKADTPLRLWCGAVGAPPPRVTWTKDGGNVPKRHEHMLTVSPFTSEDQGVYTCEAKNIRRSWKVVALQAPHWEGTMANVNVTEGGSAHVTCGRPLGQPPPKVHWLLNSQTVIHEKGITANGSELHIEHAEKRYAGIVQCFACNQLGCAYQAAFFTVVPTQIYDREYLLDTDKVMAATVSPKRHNRKNFRKNKGLMVPPSRPNVTRMSDTSVMVTWSNANHGIPIQFFKVQYKEAITNNTQWHTAKDDIPPYIHSHEIDQLDTDKYYKFRIAAIYENQDNKLGPSSGKFHLHRGDMHQKPSAPKLTQAVATSPYTIVVNWTWSNTNGVPVDGFYVYWRTVSSAGAYQVSAAGGAGARGAVLRRLQPDTHYEVKACAYNAHAPSDFVSIPSTKTVRLANATETTTEGRLGDVRGAQAAPGALVTAGGVLGLAGVAAVLGVVMLLLCRRANRPAGDKEKVSVPESGSNNGYISAKVPITITANPMHAESGDSGVEMSFLHNNNTGNDDDNLPHAGKNAPNRQYV